MVSEDWANPFFGQGVERNCRFYSETHDCVFEETLLSINLVALILSFIGSVVGLWGIVKIGWRKNERWKITEKVAAFFTFYFISFLIALVGRILINIWPFLWYYKIAAGYLS
ncbi:hypothetical protein BDF19DRAFT_49746 [Syncephalis fuscata]|nr:hypothetical protein BDF19DRAFT_49746 [Syncephalis fuscata]